MSHPFQVGKPYRNRNGEYVVEAIDGNQMKIRYTEGGTLMTDVNIQARIWENIQFEEQMARTEARRQQAHEARAAARRRSARARRERARPSFDGFEKGDFDTSGRGIAWSGRRDMGRLLAFELNRQGQESFDQWIVPYQSEIHVGRKAVYDSENRELNAALFVATSEDGASYGFHVGKPAGTARPNWPWSALTTALVEQEPLREKLRKREAWTRDEKIFAVFGVLSGLWTLIALVIIVSTLGGYVISFAQTLPGLIVIGALVAFYGFRWLRRRVARMRTARRRRASA